MVLPGMTVAAVNELVTDMAWELKIERMLRPRGVQVSGQQVRVADADGPSGQVVLNSYIAEDVAAVERRRPTLTGRWP